MRKLLSLIFVFFIVCSINLLAATEDSFEITAAKPYTMDDWEWIAVIENIYENPNGETYKGEILDGQQIPFDITSFLSDDWTDLFYFEYVTNYLVTSTISFKLSPFMNSEDATEVIPVKFRITMDTEYNPPKGFAAFPLGEGKIEVGSSSTLYGFEPSAWQMINAPQITAIKNNNSEWGYFKGNATVEAMLDPDSDFNADSIVGKKWALPIQAVFTVEGE